MLIQVSQISIWRAKMEGKWEWGGGEGRTDRWTESLTVPRPSVKPSSAATFWLSDCETLTL